MTANKPMTVRDSIACAKEYDKPNSAATEALLCLADECERLRASLAESKERERVAIASWDEERKRALREGARVVAANRLLNEAFSHVRNIPLADDISKHLAATGATKYL